MTTFSDIVNEFDNEKIVKRLVELYPDQNESDEGYRQVLGALRDLVPVPSTCELVLTSDEWVSVDGLENGEYVALDFTAWAEWLGMAVTAESLGSFERLDIAAHGLWEMSYHGYDEAVIQGKIEAITAPLHPYNMAASPLVACPEVLPGTPEAIE